MKASSLSFRAAVLLVVAGMIWGIAMAISENHQTMPAHAHLNLLGWVSLFLFGVFYHLHPTIDHSRAAILQVWIWIGATVLLSIAVGMIYTGRAIGDPIAAIASSGGWYSGATQWKRASAAPLRFLPNKSSEPAGKRQLRAACAHVPTLVDGCVWHDVLGGRTGSTMALLSPAKSRARRSTTNTPSPHFHAIETSA